MFIQDGTYSGKGSEVRQDVAPRSPAAAFAASGEAGLTGAPKQSDVPTPPGVPPVIPPAGQSVEGVPTPVDSNTDDDNDKKRRWIAPVLATAAVVVATACLLDARDDDGPVPGDTPGLSDEDRSAADAYGVGLPSFDCVVDADHTVGRIVIDGNTYIVPDIGAVKGTDPTVRNTETKLRSGNLSTPIVTEIPLDKEQILLQEQSAICEDLLLGFDAVHMLDQFVIDGKRLGDVDTNDWLRDNAGDVEDINDRALALLPQYEKAVADMDDDEIREMLVANDEYMEIANRVNTLLGMAYNSGLVVDVDAGLNHELEARGAQAGSLPEIVENPEGYTGNFLRLRFTDKENNCEVDLLLNVDGKRLAEEEDKVCIVFSTTTTSPTGEITTTTTVVTTSTTTLPEGRKDTPATLVDVTTTTTIAGTTTTAANNQEPVVTAPDNLTTDPDAATTPPEVDVYHPDLGPVDEEGNPTEVTPAPSTSLPPAETEDEEAIVDGTVEFGL
ncbi:MAG: hypothetical protein ACI9T8_000403 [Candidatus Saccharimonadales bacterium]|jgi:hypothetical protein